MASPGQLVEIVASATGLPRATVAEIDRRLAKAGLRSSGGRGLSAPKMTVYDAANLLLGALLGLEGRDTARLVQDLGDLTPIIDAETGRHQEPWDLSWVPGPPIVPQGDHNLRDFFAQVILSAREGRLKPAIEAGLAYALANTPDGHLIRQELTVKLSYNPTEDTISVLVMLCAGYGQGMVYRQQDSEIDDFGLLRMSELYLDAFLRVGEGLRNAEPKNFNG